MILKDRKTQRQKADGSVNIAPFLGFIIFCALLLPAGYSFGTSRTEDSTGTGKNSAAPLYPDKEKNLTTVQCMQCHPEIATLLRNADTMHSRVDCRQCHLQFHVYLDKKTSYSKILPQCTRCHQHPHGEELVNCSSCHQEAHAPLSIPASRALSQGCYVCHPALDKEMKTFTTSHTDLYCTACHHTKHGYIPSCLECHQPHTGTMPTPGKMMPGTGPLARCLSCHPPHKALKVAYPKTTPNTACGFCHRKAKEMLQKSNTKHSRFHCTRCHPGKHKTIKRCTECHGHPHPEAMLKKFNSCGGCHGVAHSVVR